MDYTANFVNLYNVALLFNTIRSLIVANHKSPIILPMKSIIPLFYALVANAAVLEGSTLGTMLLQYKALLIPVEKRQLRNRPSPFTNTNTPMYLYPAPRIVKKTPLKPVTSRAPKAEIFTQASREQLIFGPFQLQPVAVRTDCIEYGSDSF